MATVVGGELAAWQPQEDGLREICGLLEQQMAPMAGDKSVIMQRLQHYSQFPDFNNYLAFILSRAEGKSVEVRQAAGLLLKNNLGNAFKTMPPANQQYIKSVTLPCMGAVDRQIRSTAGTIISTFVQIAGVAGWPELLHALVKCLDSNDANHMEGAMDALSKASLSSMDGVKSKEDINENNRQENVAHDLVTNVEKKKKKKKKKTKKRKSDKIEDDCTQASLCSKDGVKSKEDINENNRQENVTHDLVSNVEKKKKNKKSKKRKSDKIEDDCPQEKSTDKEMTISNKKVRFSGEVEVFTLPDVGNAQEDTLVQGKRFTKEENEIVKQAVYKYIESHNLGEDGLSTVLNCKSSKLKGCWKEIGAAIPYRPYKAVYRRAQVIFRRSDKRKWSEEDIEIIKEYQAEHGNQWKELADELGTHRWHVKDAWRRTKLANRNKGSWSQEEYQRLFNLVNTDLQLKVDEEKHSKHGMLRDNISWTAISDQVSSRTQAACCVKWYRQLTSPMVAQGIWADVDDYRLLAALYSLDANCSEDVDWDNILDNRSGDLSRKRWNQMVLHIGHHGNKSFSEQVDVLAQRYCPNLIEARETWDSKPRVP